MSFTDLFPGNTVSTIFGGASYNVSRHHELYEFFMIFLYEYIISTVLTIDTHTPYDTHVPYGHSPYDTPAHIAWKWSLRAHASEA